MCSVCGGRRAAGASPIRCVGERITATGVPEFREVAWRAYEGVLRSQHRVYDGSGEVARTQDVWGAEGISGRVKFLPLAWAGMPKTSFRKNSDSPLNNTVTNNRIISSADFSAGDMSRSATSNCLA
ncbi:hypothetical protein BPLS_P4833 [Bathymodiolus platifrons methanotrophic gill symbiont]|nr:hypothetical protein BPLS_P4833 [Bathymodiolus platifrons methanotrophic gill symbiont]